MKLAEATATIRRHLSRLNKAYTREVFDEYAVVSFKAGRGGILVYEGEREAEFRQAFVDDMVPLRREILADQPEHGDFGFTRDGAGTYFDAFVCLGPDTYAIFNNTLKSMEEITQDALWLTAQSEFVALSQQFSTTTVDL
jgi:hypothetical protein